MKEIQGLQEIIESLNKYYDSIDKATPKKYISETRCLPLDDIILPDEESKILNSVLDDDNSIKYVKRKGRREEYSKLMTRLKEVYNAMSKICKECTQRNECTQRIDLEKDFDSLTWKQKMNFMLFSVKVKFQMQKQNQIATLREDIESYKPATGDFVDILEKAEEGLSVKHRKYLKASEILTEKKIKDKRAFCQTVYVLYHNKVKDSDPYLTYKEFGELAVAHYNQSIKFNISDAYWYASQWEYEHHKLNFTEYIKERRPARDISF